MDMAMVIMVTIAQLPTVKGLELDSLDQGGVDVMETMETMETTETMGNMKNIILLGRYLPVTFRPLLMTTIMMTWLATGLGMITWLATEQERISLAMMEMKWRRK